MIQQLWLKLMTNITSYCVDSNARL